MVPIFFGFIRNNTVVVRPPQIQNVAPGPASKRYSSDSANITRTWNKKIKYLTNLLYIKIRPWFHKQVLFTIVKGMEYK